MQKSKSKSVYQGLGRLFRRELTLDILLGHQYFLSYVHIVAVLYTANLYLFTSL